MSTEQSHIFAGNEFPALGAGMRKAVMALRSAKQRRLQGLFIVEGSKALSELLPLFTCTTVIASHRWLTLHADEVAGIKTFVAKTADFERLSSLSNPPDVIGIFELPERRFEPSKAASELVIALDGIQDPGNLGTIIRACDWFGVKEIICSRDTVDLFNPKVIQSTMGAIGRVNVNYVDLPATLADMPAATPLIGTFLDGENIYSSTLPRAGVIVMGNEGHGISPEVAELINMRLFIPPYPVDATHVESLNVAMATSITLAEFRRRSLTF